ncbi:hypothetical protein Pmani_032174 [Petrolisthes manimaculis]|uniref:Peptidase M14 carboxypeptidase A domain-containing protein n=1 Tax=Petrolisthes manimaculis TaxID=1843537 RepID=A0AAE1NUA0_9EUCA|nr:hypothetical protein Pmani_032174 [Petrolisthes manimaculis]
MKVRWCDLDLVLDLHSHTSLLGTFIYGNSYDDVYRHERHIVFPKMVSHACEDYCHYNTIYNRDPSKANTARRWLCGQLRDSTNVYTVQTSIYAYRSHKGHLVPYTEDIYQTIENRSSLGVNRIFPGTLSHHHQIPHSFPLPIYKKSNSLFQYTSSRLTSTFQCLHPVHYYIPDPDLFTAMGESWVDLRTGRNLVRAVLDYYQFLGQVPYSVPSAQPLHDLPRGRGPASPPLNTRASRNQLFQQPPHLQTRGGAQQQQQQQQGRTGRVRWAGGGGRRRASDTSPAPTYPGDTHTQTDDTTDEEEEEEEEEEDDDERGGSERSGLVVRIQHKSLPAPPRSIRLQHRPTASTLEGGSSMRGVGRGARHPSTNYVTLFPGQAPPPHPHSDDDTRSLPDLPSLTASLPALRTAPPRRRRPRQPGGMGAGRGGGVSWQEPRLTYRYYDFRRLTRPRRRRHKRRGKSRSPSRPRRPRPRRRPPSPPPVSPPRPRRMAAGGGFNASRMAGSGRGEVGPGQGAPRGVSRIDVNQLTIGGYRGDAAPRWQATPRPALPPAPPLLRRFLDPHAPLF